MSIIARYGLPKDILSKGQKTQWVILYQDGLTGVNNPVWYVIKFDSSSKFNKKKDVWDNYFETKTIVTIPSNLSEYNTIKQQPGPPRTNPYTQTLYLRCFFFSKVGYGSTPPGSAKA